MDQVKTLDQICLVQQEELEKQPKVSLNSFKLLTVIGKGSYAKVVLVRKIDDQKVYALKMLKKVFIKKQQDIDHVITERAILTECNHPFIIKLAYAFQTDEKLYFCLEYCPGGELYHLLCNKNYLTEDQSRFYACQMILALEYLHLKNIVYRDLKPENALIDKQGFIKLTDFGLSIRGIIGNEGDKARCGTPEYLAPEVLIGNHGKAVDWWTLGQIIYEMVSGQPAYTASTREELFLKIKTQAVQMIPTFSNNLKDLLQKLFIKDPNQRLGGSEGACEIKDHAWFKNINWDDVLQKRIKPFFIPHLTNDSDVSHFDANFVIQSISPNQSSAIQTEPDKFEGISAISIIDFSYQQLPSQNQISPKSQVSPKSDTKSDSHSYNSDDTFQLDVQFT